MTTNQKRLFVVSLISTVWVVFCGFALSQFPTNPPGWVVFLVLSVPMLAVGGMMGMVFKELYDYYGEE